MKDATAYLTEMGINMSGRVRAVQTAAELDFDADTYRRIIGELTGDDDVNIGDDEVKFVFRYTVQGIAEGQPVDIAYGAAVPKGIDYVATHPWVLAKPDYESNYTPKSTVDALGQPKQKKGAKKQAAIKFWKENQGKYTTRKEWIEALADAVGLTSAAASTYHHNLNKGNWA